MNLGGGWDRLCRSAARRREPAGRWRLRCLAGVWLALAPAASFAAEPRHIRFDRISIDDGLSAASVPSMLQDSTGFMWFGTQDGLDRYDGSEFVVFRHDPENPASLPNSWVRSLLEDPSGDLWIATGGGLGRWHRTTDSFSTYRHDPEDPRSLAGDRVSVLYRDGGGTLWVGTELAGLDRFDEASGGFHHFRHDPDDPASLADDRVRAIYEDRHGRLWIGTFGGLHLLDRESGTFTRFRHDPDDPASLADDGVRSILEDRSGSLWIGTLGGLHRLIEPAGGSRPAFERLRHDPVDRSSLSEDRVRVLFEDSDGRLWIGTDGGLNLYDRSSESFSHYRHRADDPHSLSMDRVVSIYQDRGGVLWVGTEGGGINKWHPRSWSFSSDRISPTDLSSRYILAVTEDGSGNLWVGTNGHGLNRVDRATGAVRRFLSDPADPASLADGRVTTLLRDREGVLWVGTLAGGLDRYDPATGTFVHFPHDPDRDDSLGARGVMSLYEDRHGVLWVGTFGGGLNRLDRETGTFVRFRHDPEDPRSLSNDRVTAFAEGPGETLWVGTFGGGLDRFDRDSGTFLGLRHDPGRPASLASDTVFSLHRTPAGTLWIGTQAGLDRLVSLDETADEGTFKHYTQRHGLPSNYVFAIYSDAGGRLWLATNNGLARFDPRTETFKTFDSSHGLQSNEFNMGAHYQSPSGELIFGGVDGFNAFFPERIETNTHVPPVVLTSFSKLNQRVHLDRPIFDAREIALSWRDNVFSFDFAALDFTAPEKNRYRYRLEGFTEDWIDLGRRRRVSFTNLDPGSYVLRVNGSNNDGVWNGKGTSIRIVIAPPPWRTWWAYALYVLALAAVVSGFVRSQQRKVERERQIARRERAQAEERGRLIAELEVKNAELERFNYTVSHDLKSPLVTIKGFLGLLRRDVRAGQHERVEHDIDRIAAATDRMHVLLEELLELSRVGRQLNPPQEVAMGEIAHEALEQIGGLIAANKAMVRIAPDLPSAFGDRVRLLEVYQNLLENAVKYMGQQPEPRVEVGAERNGAPDIVFFVRDNGMGIDPRYHEKIFGLFERLHAHGDGTGVGLTLVRRIVELHGGRVWVESKGAGLGSTFRFTLPPAPSPDGGAAGG